MAAIAIEGSEDGRCAANGRVSASRYGNLLVFAIHDLAPQRMSERSSNLHIQEMSDAGFGTGKIDHAVIIRPPA